MFSSKIYEHMYDYLVNLRSVIDIQHTADLLFMLLDTSSAQVCLTAAVHYKLESRSHRT